MISKVSKVSQRKSFNVDSFAEEMEEDQELQNIDESPDEGGIQAIQR